MQQIRRRPITRVGARQRAADAHSLTRAQRCSPGVAIDSIDGLAEVWDTVVDKLSALASSAQERAGRSAYKLDTIEFQIGVEAGVNVWLVTKGTASVTLTFKRAQEDA